MEIKWKECQINDVHLIHKPILLIVNVNNSFFFPSYRKLGRGELIASSHQKEKNVQHEKWREAFDQQTQNSTLCIHILSTIYYCNKNEKY